MIFTSKNQVFDYQEHSLERLIKLLDSSLQPIISQIETGLSAGVDMNCLCDEAEYVIGVGFCVMQQYMMSILQDIHIDQGLARSLGPKSQKGTPIAQLIHAAGNYWKHEPEWHIWLPKLQERSQKTIDVILHGKDNSHWPLTDLLYEMSCSSKTSDIRLFSCLHDLKIWRKSVYEKSEPDI